MRSILMVFACVGAMGACHNERDIRLEPGTNRVAQLERPTPVPKFERGEYLASMLGCRFCHMATSSAGPDVSKPFAGGLEVEAKFGSWRSPNITQHKTSGIGAWTDDQIAVAIREGVRPDGTQLYPIMPYLNFNRMTDADVMSLVAYLRTVPPVDNAVAPNNLQLPQPRAPKPLNDPDPVSDTVKHGEYLVTIMNCSSCHTPSGANGMPDPSRALAGGVEIDVPIAGKLYASNITSDSTTGIGASSHTDIEKAVREKGGIGWAWLQGYLADGNQMTDADLQAIVTYLKTAAPVRNEVPKSTYKSMKWADLLSLSRNTKLFLGN